VLERPLRFLAIALSLLVAAGFTLFAVDDFQRASNNSRDRISGNARPDPTPRAERQREDRNSTGRELIDDANDVLLRPFAGLVANDKSRWVQRGVPALLGLLVYGFMLGYLARFARGHGGPSATRTRRQASRA
jgi:H+/Cl- antiporter ClcA